jgi:hypothetical protein
MYDPRSVNSREKSETYDSLKNQNINQNKMINVKQSSSQISQQKSKNNTVAINNNNYSNYNVKNSAPTSPIVVTTSSNPYGSGFNDDDDDDLLMNVNFNSFETANKNQNNKNTNSSSNFSNKPLTSSNKTNSYNNKTAPNPNKYVDEEGEDEILLIIDQIDTKTTNKTSNKLGKAMQVQKANPESNNRAAEILNKASNNVIKRAPSLTDHNPKINQASSNSNMNKKTKTETEPHFPNENNNFDDDDLMYLNDIQDHYGMYSENIVKKPVPVQPPQIQKESNAKQSVITLSSLSNFNFLSKCCINNIDPYDSTQASCVHLVQDCFIVTLRSKLQQIKLKWYQECVVGQERVNSKLENAYLDNEPLTQLLEMSCKEAKALHKKSIEFQKSNPHAERNEYFMLFENKRKECEFKIEKMLATFFMRYDFERKMFCIFKIENLKLTRK